MSAIAYISLSKLTSRLAQVFRSEFGYTQYWVVGEITNFNHYAAKQHYYFELIEKEEGSNKIVAKIFASIFGSSADSIKEFERLTGQSLDNGMQVLVLVRVDYHAVYGLRLVVLEIDPTYTLGALEAQRRKTLDRLVAENPHAIRLENGVYTTTNNRLGFAPVIQRIAIISSENSAGFQDFMHSLKHNDFNYVFRCDCYFTEVQGDHAGAMVQKMITVYRSAKPYDALVIIRGGGSQTDFLMFDSYKLAQAVARFPIPVISGIGHQKNETLVDLMAHSPLKTPTKAAEFIIAHNKAFEIKVLKTGQHLFEKAREVTKESHFSLGRMTSVFLLRSKDTLNAHKSKLQASGNQLPLRAVELIYTHKGTLSSLKNELFSSIRTRSKNQKHELTRLSEQLALASTKCVRGHFSAIKRLEHLLALLSTENTLKRGFVLLRKGGKTLHDVSALSVGDSVELEAHNYSMEAELISVESIGEQGVAL